MQLGACRNYWLLIVISRWKQSAQNLSCRPALIASVTLFRPCSRRRKLLYLRLLNSPTNSVRIAIKLWGTPAIATCDALAQHSVVACTCDTGSTGRPSNSAICIRVCGAHAPTTSKAIRPASCPAMEMLRGHGFTGSPQAGEQVGRFIFLTVAHF